MFPKIGDLEATIGELEAENRRLKAELAAAEDVVSWVPTVSLEEVIPTPERKGNLKWVNSPLYKMFVSYDNWLALKSDGKGEEGGPMSR